jgi:hypothetical protein
MVDRDWKLGPKGGSLTALDTVTTFVRLASGGETFAPKRGANVVNPYRSGAIAVDVKHITELLIGLEVGYPITNEATLYTNKETVEQLLFGKKSFATLRRTTPSDTIEAYVEPVAPSVQTQNRFTYLYSLRAPEGFWRSTSQTTDSTTPVAVGGNGSVHDAVIDIDTGATGTGVVLTMTDDDATITIAGATPAGGVRVDLEAGTVTKITGGADYHEFVSFGLPYRIILEPGDNPFTGAGGGSGFSFKFFDKYRA